MTKLSHCGLGQDKDASSPVLLNTTLEVPARASDKKQKATKLQKNT